MVASHTARNGKLHLAWDKAQNSCAFRHTRAYKPVSSELKSAENPKIAQVIGINIGLQLVMPEAVCYCFDIRVVLSTSIPSLIVRNANTSKL